jgi:hypothetical protein
MWFNFLLLAAFQLVGVHGFGPRLLKVERSFLSHILARTHPTIHSSCEQTGPRSVSVIPALSTQTSGVSEELAQNKIAEIVAENKVNALGTYLF